MASPYVPGPCPIWVNLDDGGALTAFLGMSERGVSIDLNPEYSPYVVDGAGSVPVDAAYQGQAATVTCSLSRWNESTYRAIGTYAGRPRDGTAFTGAKSRGTDFPGDVGTLVANELSAFHLYVPFPYSNKFAYGPGGLGINAQPFGYHFYRAYLDRDSLPERTAKGAILNLTFHCVRRLFVDGNNALGLNNYRWVLYDNDVSAVQFLPLN